MIPLLANLAANAGGRGIFSTISQISVSQFLSYNITHSIKSTADSGYYVNTGEPGRLIA